jgi:hypothetical protein
MRSYLLATTKQLAGTAGAPRNCRKDADSELLATLLNLELITEMPLPYFLNYSKFFNRS